MMGLHRRQVLPVVLSGAFLAPFLMAGCTSLDGARYYTLDMRPSGGAACDIPVEVGRFRAGEALRGRNIMIHKNATEIEYYELDQWVSGLEEMIREKLSAELSSAPGDDAGGVFVSGTIKAFEQVDLPGGGAEAHARLRAAYRPRGESRSTEPLIEKTYDARLPAEEARAGAVVRALSKCLEAIAAEMAKDIRSL